MRRNLDVLCIGEAMVGLHPVGGCSLATATEFEMSVGGAELNVATALAGAGRRVAWAGAVGADPFGERILAHLARHDIASDLVLRANRPTGLYVKDPDPGGSALHYYRAGSAGASISASDLDRWGASTHPRLIHVSGITALISERAAGLTQRLLRDRPFGDTALSFDVNMRAGLAVADTPAMLLSLARLADIVFVGRDEAAELWMTESADDIRALLPESAVLVVKDAACEAVEFHGADRIAVGALPVEVVEPTGAGDAFAAGWIDAWLRGAGSRERLSAGHEYAAVALRSRTDHGASAAAGT